MFVLTIGHDGFCDFDEHLIMVFGHLLAEPGEGWIPRRRDTCATHEIGASKQIVYGDMKGIRYGYEIISTWACLTSLIPKQGERQNVTHDSDLFNAHAAMAACLIHSTREETLETL